jgi:hypothetical protein
MPLIAGATVTIVAIVLAAGVLAVHPTVPRAHAEGGDSGDVLLPVTHEHFNAVETHGVGEGGDPLSLGSLKNAAPTLCNAVPTAAADANTDCELDGNTPHNETSTPSTRPIRLTSLAAPTTSRSSQTPVAPSRRPFCRAGA